MLIGIIFMSIACIAIITMWFNTGLFEFPKLVFRRHGKGLALQQGKSTFNLPVIEFEEYEDKYGDELKAEIDEAYKLWYYGKEKYTRIVNVTKLKIALENRSCVYWDTKDSYNMIGFNDISEYRILRMVDAYLAGEKFNMYDAAIHDAIYECEKIINHIDNITKREHEIKEEEKHKRTVVVMGNRYTYDVRYETSEQAVRRITKTIELNEEQEFKRKQTVIEDIKKNGLISKNSNSITPLFDPFKKHVYDNYLYNPFSHRNNNYY